MVEGGDRLDALLQQGVGQRAVEVESPLDRRAAARRLHTGPRDGEPVGAHPEIGHDLDVLAPAVVVVGGHVTGVAVPHPAGRVRVGVPDGGVRPPAEAAPSIW